MSITCHDNDTSKHTNSFPGVCITIVVQSSLRFIPYCSPNSQKFICQRLGIKCFRYPISKKKLQLHKRSPIIWERIWTSERNWAKGPSPMVNNYMSHMHKELPIEFDEHFEDQILLIVVVRWLDETTKKDKILCLL